MTKQRIQNDKSTQTDIEWKLVIKFWKFPIIHGIW